MSSAAPPQNNENELPLPFGWIKEYDPSSEHYFYVDTKATPPRAIWTHPYEDEQYLNEHPDVKEKVQSMLRQMEQNRARQDLESPPAYMPERRHSYTGRDNDDMGRSSNGSAAVIGAGPGADKKGKGKDKNKGRGFFGKIKDEMIGTKQEREEWKRQEAIERKRRDEMYAKQLQAQRAAQRQYYQQQQQYAQAGPSGVYVQQGGYGGYGGGYGGGGLGGGYGGGYGQTRYGPPPMPYNQRGQSGFGGANVGLGLLGGLAGGLLLGDLLF